MKIKLLLVVFFSSLSFTVSAQVLIKLTSIPRNSTENIKIYVAGDFNNWNPADENNQLSKQEDGTYFIAINTEKEDINYKFTLGSWDKVECDIRGNDIANRNSKNNPDNTVYAEIAAWKTGLKKSTCSANVHIVKDDFHIPQLNRKRKIWIYLPPDYQKNKKRYPVLYMHDGQNLFDDTTSYSGEWAVDESLNLI